MSADARVARAIIETPDVTPDVLDAAEEVFNGWFADETRIVWDEFIDRLESMLDVDFGGSMMSPAINRVKAHIRTYRKLGA